MLLYPSQHPFARPFPFAHHYPRLLIPKRAIVRQIRLTKIRAGLQPIFPNPNPANSTRPDQLNRGNAASPIRRVKKKKKGGEGGGNIGEYYAPPGNARRSQNRFDDLVEKKDKAHAAKTSKKKKRENGGEFKFRSYESIVLGDHHPRSVGRNYSIEGTGGIKMRLRPHFCPTRLS